MRAISESSLLVPKKLGRPLRGDQEDSQAERLEPRRDITLLSSANPPYYERYARAAVRENVEEFETPGNNRELLFNFWSPFIRVRC